MGCCLYFLQGSKPWLALLLPIFAVFASAHGTLLISISLSIVVVLFSTMFLFIFTKQEKPIILDPCPLLIKEARTETIDFPPQDCSCNDSGEVVLAQKEQDLYSESESMEQFSSSSSEEEEEEEEGDHCCSDIEWPYYNMGQRLQLDCSDDGSISDEESLIEIAIPSGHFVSPHKDFNLKCCKLSHQEPIFHKDLLAEEDNLIEIDIYMGSIKYSRFDL